MANYSPLSDDDVVDELDGALDVMNKIHDLLFRAHHCTYFYYADPQLILDLQDLRDAARDLADMIHDTLAKFEDPDD